VTADSPDDHVVQVCGYDTGWLRDPATGQRTQPVTTSAGDVELRLVGGAWRVADVAATPDRDCTGVVVPEVTW
jgi:hypothetical protein